ncbi:MAG: STAS/SEC14 domain-containing protein [Thermodesulfobacteriota bacterium]
MPIKFHVDQSKNLTTFHVDGPMSFDEVQKAIKQFYEGKSSQPTKHILWDLRSAKVDRIRSKEAEDLAFFAASIDKRKDIGKTAIVASSDLVYEVAKIFEGYIDNPDIQFDVFRSIDKATEWLGKDPE